MDFLWMSLALELNTSEQTLGIHIYVADRDWFTKLRDWGDSFDAIANNTGRRPGVRIFVIKIPAKLAIVVTSIIFNCFISVNFHL